VGRRDAPGRPALFGTTSAFLETFGLRALSDLPPLREVESLIAAPIAEGDAEASALEPPAEDVTDDAEAADETGAETPREAAESAFDEAIRFH
ncbi:MAG: SMC-Scp complex subunit ScpB, partial [Myxococcota bacterium]